MSIRDWFRPRGAHAPGNDAPIVASEPLPFGGVDQSGSTVVTFTPRLVEMLRLGGSQYNLGELWRTQPSVRICVNFIAFNQAHLRLKGYTRPEDHPEYDRESPLNELLEYPNPRTTGFEFRRGTTSDIAIYDTAYWWKVGARPGAQPARLYRIPPDLVVPRGGDIFKGPHHYDILGPEGTFPLTPEEVVDFGGYHPQDTRVGSSPLESLAAVLNEEVEASRHRAYYWKNAARREGVIERPVDAPEWDSEARDRFAQSWRNRMAGGNKAGETGILEDGMKWNPDSFSPRDSEFIAGREFTLDTAASVYQIPLAMLGRKGTQTYASMREYHKVLYVDVLGPWNARIEGAVQLQLVPDFRTPGLYVEFNIDEKLQGDFEQQSDAIRSAVQVPWMSVNQALKLRNLPPVGDPEDPTNPFNFPARPTAYMYEGEERPTAALPAPDNPPQGGENMPMTNGHRTDPIASMNDLAAILEDIT